jgi:flavodoxin
VKVWLIYDSKFGNNKNIANKLASYFEDDNEVFVKYAKDISPKEVIKQGIDILLLGGPPRAGMISFTIKSWANKMIKQLNKEGKILNKVALWGSHATNDENTPEKFGWEGTKNKWNIILNDIPAEKKINDTVGFSVNPETLEGPLEPGWEEIAEKLALDLKNL